MDLLKLWLEIAAITWAPCCLSLWVIAIINAHLIGTYPPKVKFMWGHVFLGTIVTLIPVGNFIIIGTAAVGGFIAMLVLMDWSWMDSPVFQKTHSSSEY